jgi:hypothetical protein
MTPTPNDTPTAHAADEVIERAKREGCCVKPDDERQGKCHVFVDYADRCQCGERRLERERMR